MIETSAFKIYSLTMKKDSACYSMFSAGLQLTFDHYRKAPCKKSFFFFKLENTFEQ